MLTETQRDYVKTAVLPMQIIVGALFMGVVMFFGVVLFLRDKDAVQHTVPPYLSLIGIVVAFGAVVLSFVMPRLVGGSTRAAADDSGRVAGSSERRIAPADEKQKISRLLAAHQTKLILGSALLEGAAFFNLVALLLEGQWVSALVAGVLAMMLLSQIPTVARLETLVENELAR